ncbi:MAG: 2-oxoglutarate oxidoreductase [Candidatus Melainabacteria bacterium]|nr:2-oxoglutarate oxidoreductase [Candidatus Melainabacteria bacterium]
MEKVFERPQTLRSIATHYCPGCGHGLIHRILCEVIDELGIREQTIGVAPVGCSVLMYNYLDVDMFEAAHGRAPAIATGCKRVRPDLVVFAYQGDGDLAAIGTAETVHTAARGENITTIFVNNAIYGMTGGQLAPTSLVGQKTTTTPTGRLAEFSGYPIRICEMLATLDGPAYIARVAVSSPKYVVKAKQAIRKAFETQLNGLGYSLVEVLSPCPINWHLTPTESTKWLEENMMAYFPLGEFKVAREKVQK